MMKLFRKGKATATSIQNWQKKMQEAKEKKIGKQVKTKRKKKKKKNSSSVGILHITQNFENGK